MTWLVAETWLLMTIAFLLGSGVALLVAQLLAPRVAEPADDEVDAEGAR